MSVHAFVDESVRGRLYLVVVTVAAPEHLGTLRRDLKAMRLRGERELHFRKQKPPRQRELADRIAALAVATHVYTAAVTTPKREEDARQRCLAQSVADLLDLRAHRLVLDSREHRDAHDRASIQRALGARPAKTELTYEHLESGLEPILWVSDAVAWCYGAGGAMRAKVAPIVATVSDL